MYNKNVLVMCLADPSGNPRPNRMISLCRDEGLTVDVVSYPISGELEFSQHYSVKKHKNQLFDEIKRITCRHVSWFLPNVDNIRDLINNYAYGVRHLEERLSDENYSFVIVEDLKLLPLAFAIKGNSKIIFDAREYYPLQKENSFYFNFFEKPERIRLCHRYLQQCDHVMTVSNGLKDKYLYEFNINSTVVRSTPYYRDIPVFKNQSDRIKLVYHGAAHRNRQIEKMIHIASELNEKYTLDLYLVGNKHYIADLIKLCKKYENIDIRPAIVYESIIPTLNQYDMGFCYFEPTTFNLKHALPNKLFEYIQARVPVIAGPSPDMRSIINQYSCGLVSHEFSADSVISTLEDLTASEIIPMKARCDQAAKDLCYENESKKVSKIINSLL